MSPEELLIWAEGVRLAWIAEEILLSLPAPPWEPLTQRVPVDCGCGHYGICMSTACPRATRITTYLNNNDHATAFDDMSWPTR